MKSVSKIAFVGLGKMGGGIARHLISCGYELMVYDANPTMMESFAGICRLADSIEELVAYGDLVGVCLPGSPEVAPVVVAFLSSKPNGRYFLDFSSGFPIATAGNSARIKKAGGFFLEAPMTGGPAHAATGELGLIAAGDKNIYEELLPILEQIASKVSYAGEEAGCGQIIKLAVNYLAISYIALYAEIMPFLDSFGVDYNVFYDVVVSNGAADCGMFRRIAPKINSNNYPVSFLLQHAVKDIGYVKRLFEEKGYPSLMLDSCVNLFNIAKCLGYEANDVSEVARVTKIFMGQGETGKK